MERQGRFCPACLRVVPGAPLIGLARLFSPDHASIIGDLREGYHRNRQAGLPCWIKKLDIAELVASEWNGPDFI